MTPAPRPRSQVSPRTVWTVGLHTVALLAVLSVVRAASTALSWVLLALFLALAAHPLVASAPPGAVGPGGQGRHPHASAPASPPTEEEGAEVRH